MSGSVGLGVQVPDFGRTLALAEGVRASRLAQLAQQRDIDQADALAAAMPGIAEGLAGADPNARQSALRTLVGLGPRGMSIALPMLERDAAPAPTRSRNVGNQMVDEEYDRATRQWRQIGAAPRWAPQAPRTTFTDIRDPAGNVIAQRASTGQYIPIARGEGNMFGSGENGLALQFLTHTAEAYAAGNTTPSQDRQFETALSIAQRPRVAVDPATGTITTITPQLPEFVARAVEARRAPAAVSSAAGRDAALEFITGAPQAASDGAQPSAAPFATPGAPADEIAPGVRQAQAIVPRAVRETARKMEIETRRVTDAMDQYLRALDETGGPGVNTYLNNPWSPDAQRILGAYNNLVTALRSEAFMNTGVLQPAEMTMIEQMLLAPDSLRGAAATPQAIAARLNEIRTFVEGGLRRAQEAAGMPHEASPRESAPGSAPTVMRWNPATGRIE